MRAGGRKVRAMKQAVHRGHTPRWSNESQRPEEGYGMVARWMDGRTYVLVLEMVGGERVLPVFSVNVEAEMFIWLEGLGSFPDEAWYPRETASGELLAMLIGPRGSVGRVALDPSPEIMSPSGADEMELVCISRKDFVERLLSERREEPLAECRSSTGNRAAGPLPDQDGDLEMV